MSDSVGSAVITAAYDANEELEKRAGTIEAQTIEIADLSQRVTVEAANAENYRARLTEALAQSAVIAAENDRLEAEVARLEALLNPKPVTLWGVNYKANPPASEALTRGKAQVARIFYQGLGGKRLADEPKVKRAIADGVRTLVVSYKDTLPSNSDIFWRDARADITSGVLPTDLKVYVCFRHEPENDGTGAQLWRDQWVSQSANIRRHGFTPISILMGYTLMPASKRNLADWTLPPGLVDVCGFDMYVDGRFPYPAIVDKVKAAAAGMSLPLAICETGDEFSNPTRPERLADLKTRLDGEALFVCYWNDADTNIDATLDAAAVKALWP